MDSTLTLEDELQHIINTEDIYFHYTILWDVNLGEGLSGLVRQCINRSTGERCALKCLRDTETSAREIALQLRCSDSPHIVKIVEVFRNTIQLPDEKFSSNKLLVVMELMSGGELFNRISKKKRFTEREACVVTKQIAQAIQHCHLNNIAHRDIKPENLLLKDTGKDMIVKLTDFGFAKIDHGNLTTPHFTPYYVSPQILEASKFQKALKAGTISKEATYTYDKSCDMWSLGVILYIMLCGYPPFYSEVPSQLFSRSMEQKILKGEYDFPTREWSRVSHVAKSIVIRLLNIDSDERLTVEELLNSTWLNDSREYEDVDLHDTGIIRDPSKFEEFKVGHAAALYDLRVPERNSDLQHILSNDLHKAHKWDSSPMKPSTSAEKMIVLKRKDVFLKLLRDIVGHLLMPQKSNYEEELVVMIKKALEHQFDGSTLPRVLARESWTGQCFQRDKLDHLRLAKAISDIIQNIQKNKRLSFYS